MPPDAITDETIAAARLRVVLDEKLGRATPDRVREIAALPAAPASQGISPASNEILTVDEFRAAVGDAVAGGRRTLLLIGIDNALRGVTGAAVAHVLGSMVRGVLEPSDLLAQFGPVEFVALVAGSGAAASERITAAVAAQDWTAMLGDGQSLHVSVGTTQAGRGETFDDLVVRADEALDEARAGQNRPSG